MRSRGGDCRGGSVVVQDMRAKAERAKVIRHAVPGGGWRIQSLRAVRRAVLFGLFAWWVVGLLSLGLSVCSFERGASCAHFGSLSWGPLGFHFGSSGACLVTILRSLGALGSILGFWGAPLGSIFGALGLLWCLWGSLGAPWGLPWPPKVPKANFSHFFPFQFEFILAPFWR